MESDQAFGKWCREQAFEVTPANLFKMRTAWENYSAVHHDEQEKLSDLGAWRRIASLNHIQKPRVLERLAKTIPIHG